MISSAENLNSGGITDQETSGRWVAEPRAKPPEIGNEASRRQAAQVRDLS